MNKSGNIALALAMLLGAAVFAMRQYHASGAPLQLNGDLCYTIAPYAIMGILALLSIIWTKSPAFLKSLRITATLMLLATVVGYADFASSSTGGLAFVFLPGLLIVGGFISLLICDLAISLIHGNEATHSHQKSKRKDTQQGGPECHKVSGPLTPDVGIRIMGYSTTNGPSTTVNGKSIDHAATISDRSRA